MTAPITRVLVTFGSKRGGTAEIATAVADSLRSQGLTVDCRRAAEVRDVAGYDAFVIGGALYAARSVREARRFVVRNAAALRARPVWMFSSGPLDDSASRQPLRPVRGVAALMAHGSGKTPWRAGDCQNAFTRASGDGHIDANHVSIHDAATVSRRRGPTGQRRSGAGSARNGDDVRRTVVLRLVADLDRGPDLRGLIEQPERVSSSEGSR